NTWNFNYPMPRICRPSVRLFSLASMLTLNCANSGLTPVAWQATGAAWCTTFSAIPATRPRPRKFREQPTWPIA
ncbi:MAG: hypothetical protein ACK6D6_18145, partial [Planctomyces sp.]